MIRALIRSARHQARGSTGPPATATAGSAKTSSTRRAQPGDSRMRSSAKASSAPPALVAARSKRSPCDAESNTTTLTPAGASGHHSRAATITSTGAPSTAWHSATTERRAPSPMASMATIRLMAGASATAIPLSDDRSPRVKAFANASSPQSGLGPHAVPCATSLRREPVRKYVEAIPRRSSQRHQMPQIDQMSADHADLDLRRGGTAPDQLAEAAALHAALRHRLGVDHDVVGPQVAVLEHEVANVADGHVLPTAGHGQAANRHVAGHAPGVACADHPDLAALPAAPDVDDGDVIGGRGEPEPIAGPAGLIAGLVVIVGDGGVAVHEERQPRALVHHFADAAVLLVTP